MQKSFQSYLLKVMACVLVVGGLNAQVNGQESTKQTREPVYRIGLANNDTTSASTETADNKTDASNASSTSTATAAPIDKALNIAYEGLDMIHRDIRDYEAVLVKRERINGKLLDPEFMHAKIRNRRPEDNVPLSVYFRFLKPKGYKDREVIWVEGQNDGKLIAHDNPKTMLGKIRANLDPEGSMAMKDNRYPIYEAGIENLVVRLIERGERDRKLGESTVEFFEDNEINGRKCSMIQVTHPNKEPYEFYMCRIYIDNELQVPIRYAGYSWPKTEGGKPVLEEEYTYLRMKLNVGLTDEDFNPDNPNYMYPGK